MDNSLRCAEGIVVTPHHLASQSALSILREGGTAIEAVVAAAATVAVVCPNDNGIGGDGFWLIIPPEGEPLVIDASGPSGSLVSPNSYPEGKMPFKGPTAAITVAGTVAGWKDALDYVSECGYQRMSLTRLLADSIHYAEKGFPVSSTQVKTYKEQEKKTYLTNDLRCFFGNATIEGEMFKQPQLAATLKKLSENGLDSFYRGELADNIYEDMKSIGMPFEKSDLSSYRSERRAALKLNHSKGVIYNTPPPTQGLVSMAVLAILENLGIDGNNEEELIHFAVEATKKAFHMRDKYITDPKYMTVTPESLITPEEITKMSSVITSKASTFESNQEPRDTVWIGAMDKRGFSVSFIQSLYQAFGSGVVLPKSGILWHNRGLAFSLDENSIFALAPGKKPFHTLNPAAAVLKDGRTLVYGSSGGDGQPQTQAAIFHRYVIQKIALQKSINMLRWVYGRNTEKHNSNLNIEDGYDKGIIEGLRKRGHKLGILPTGKTFGNAGILVRHADGTLEGAFEPRSDGSVVGF